MIKVRPVPRHLYTYKPYGTTFKNHARDKAREEGDAMADHIIIDGDRMAVQFVGTVASINIITHMVGRLKRYGGVLQTQLGYGHIKEGQWVLKEGENISIVDT